MNLSRTVSINMKNLRGSLTILPRRRCTGQSGPLDGGWTARLDQRRERRNEQLTGTVSRHGGGHGRRPNLARVHDMMPYRPRRNKPRARDESGDEGELIPGLTTARERTSAVRDMAGGEESSLTHVKSALEAMIRLRNDARKKRRGRGSHRR